VKIALNNYCASQEWEDVSEPDYDDEEEEEVTHTVTWRCAWCGRTIASILGSKFKPHPSGYKRRKCADCLTKEEVGGFDNMKQAEYLRGGVSDLEARK